MKLNKVFSFSIPHKVLENFAYVSILQIFLLFAPLITYPYLVRVLGKDLYGVIITAQVFVSYCSIIIDFGSNSIAARYIALCNQNREKLSEVVSCILSARLYLWMACSIIYSVFVFAIPSFREHYLMFILMYGMTFNDLLFPQFFFQGIEQMKHITQINIVTKLIFIILIFVLVNEPKDYFLVPVFYSVGYFVGGVISLLVISTKYRLHLTIKSLNSFSSYVKECSPLLAKDLISTVKDKLNVFFIGKYIGMGDVVVYDLGIKLVSILAKPVNIIGTVLLPRFSKNANRQKQNIAICGSLTIVLCCVIVINVFLDKIVLFFIHESIDLLPLRLLLLAPLLLSLSSSIGFVHLLANGLNKQILWSIIIASSTYCVGIAYSILTHTAGNLVTFIFISLLSYFSELTYRLYVYAKAK